MGYPMTYQRVVNRNHLSEGGYEDRTPPPVGTGAFPGPEKFHADVEYLKVVHDDLNRRREAIESLWNARRLLLGDLRRLELDSADEAATCSYIANRTGIDKEIVAVVLKEFISW